MAQIYSRSFDGEKMIILGNQEYFWQPFEFPDYGNDWNTVEVGLFYSYSGTSSISQNIDNNSPMYFEQLADQSSNYSLFGIKDGNSSADPLSVSSSFFTGFIWNLLGYAHPLVAYLPVFGRSTAGNVLRTNSRQYISGSQVRDGGDASGLYYISQKVDTSDSAYPQAVANAFTGSYYAYLGFKCEINNKGTAIQTTTMSVANSVNSLITTDASKENLLSVINGRSYTVKLSCYHTQSGNALPIPGAIYIRNGFVKNYLRIHSYIIKRVN